MGTKMQTENRTYSQSMSGGLRPLLTRDLKGEEIMPHVLL